MSLKPVTVPSAETGTGAALPIAKVLGQPYHELPQDLFIPPDALEVFLDTFEGPLDLLLYLIRRQQLDILNLPILQITAQYMEYVELMQGLNLELAAEYLLMAAWLAEIKSRLLLPKAPELEDEEEGEDPRVTLIRRLQEYERFQGRRRAPQRAATGGAGDFYRRRPAPRFWRPQATGARCFAG